ncbi:sulfite exporter TauE/SafE family protein [Leptolyngbya sp. FACHB-261]|uniref:urease accessory protein UreH domain-containing protein n=1 Tax=Leptolyngbya sp. FACHB-261 TaxID=2692806 RepID=UPI001686EE51|nr:sulfite exporter TauE/SafE family protein [Leptolyngbya sp. FACHB-261]MBD2101147.1 sulfite exporter TauE/SafE family protein [Leptolyngbya sp. FACHB-261]
MLDLLLVTALGFLGSFGHCAGMCGPLAVAFSLSQDQQNRLNQTPNLRPSWQQQLYFHGLLNLGRILSYVLIGAAIGALSSVLVAGGQGAGIDSSVRRAIAILTGGMLIWFGLGQVAPTLIPRLPLLHRLTYGGLHTRLSSLMAKLSSQQSWWTPALLGVAWGLMPCGFLYAAQIKAAETSSIWAGGATLFAFGLGTLPVMLGVGVSSALVSANRRSQLFRLGGWVTISIGVLTLLRTGDPMTDYTGHAALLCLLAALVARPISKLWPQPLRYRRALGVGGFVLALAHSAHMIDHVLGWNFRALSFMLPWHRLGMGAGFLALLLLIPAALTSFDSWMKRLGVQWRQIHLLSLPALILAVLHTGLLGSHYLGSFEATIATQVRLVVLIGVTLLALLVRCSWFWSLFSLGKLYAAPSPPSIK